MKTYTVWFVIKANRTEYLADVQVKARTAKDACKTVKVWYHDKTGKNAFRPTTKLLEGETDWYQKRGNLKHFDAVVEQDVVFGS